MKFQMLPYLFVVPMFAVTACADIGYNAPLQGEFDKTGRFAANFDFVVDYQENTFSGVMRDFQFSRFGFDRPDGAVSVTGLVSRGEGNEVLLKGTGQGTLTQNDREYMLEIELESFYVIEGETSVLGWYFGGGNFNEAGEYRDWPTIRGRFEAKIVCPTPLNLGPCTVPTDSTPQQVRF